MVNKTNNNQPLVSVVTVVFNDEKHIEATIKSVINQSYPNIEYIIIDGGSNDNTNQIIEKYSENLAYYLSEKDKGVYDGMNKAIKVANGEWIIFMNSGDSFCDYNILTDIFEYYSDNGESFLYGNTLLSYNEKKKIIETPSIKGKRMYMPIQHQSIITRTYELKSHPFDMQYKIIADFAFYYFLYKRNSKSKYYNRTISCYDMNGFSENNRKRIAKEFFLFFLRNRNLRALKFLIIYLKRSLFG